MLHCHCVATVRHEYLQIEPMNGGSRLSAIDRSTPAMSRALPDLPMRETVLVRLLWLCLSGMGISLRQSLARAASTRILQVNELLGCRK
jgi:hypothetical protein